MLPSSFNIGSEDSPWTVYEPPAPNGRSVIIAYGSDGLSPKWAPEVRRHAERFAETGILELIPEYFQKVATATHGHSDGVFGSILERHAGWAQVLRDAVTAVKGSPPTESSRVGLLGFSLGGFLALRIRDSGQTLVEFFAPYQFPALGVPPLPPILKGLRPNANLNCRFRFTTAARTRWSPPQQHADSIEALLKSEGAICRRSHIPERILGSKGTTLPTRMHGTNRIRKLSHSFGPVCDVSVFLYLSSRRTKYQMRQL